MKFITFRHDGDIRAGVLNGGTTHGNDVIDLSHRSMAPALGGLQADVAELIRVGLQEVVDAITSHGLRDEARIPLDEVDLLAPVPKPRRIYAFAHNYHDAVAERGAEPPREPVLFMKDGATVVGPGEHVVLPSDIGGCTYEAELAAVVGRRAKDVTAENALSFIAAYGTFNDVSASELIRRDGDFNRGKNVATFGPFGPFIASANEIVNPQNLKIELSVDGVVRQRSSTAQMIFSVAELVVFLSARHTLEPGDIIATGTPAGVAPVQSPPTWLVPGSTMRASIEGLGSLVNPVTEGGAFHV